MGQAGHNERCRKASRDPNNHRIHGFFSVNHHLRLAAAGPNRHINHPRRNIIADAVAIAIAAAVGAAETSSMPAPAVTACEGKGRCQSQYRDRIF